MIQILFIYLLKVFKYLGNNLQRPFDQFFTFVKFYGNGVSFSSFKSYGIPYVNVAVGGRMKIGKKLTINNRLFSNAIGRFSHCSIVVSSVGSLEIGDNLGMSSTAIVCHNNIKIGSNVNLGGNVVIYDTDFHSLNQRDRITKSIDMLNTKTKPVIIEDNVFVGAHVTILKGVTIGRNSIIGACSVVTKNVPENQVWAGNPAKFIRACD